MLVCATLLPWQAPAAALAQENTDQTSAPAPVSDDDAAKAKPFNVDLAKPGARGEAIGKTLTERVDDLKNAKLAVDAAAALQDAFKKLAADAEQLHKDLDGLKAAGLSDGGTKLAAGAADAFAAPYALVKELTAEDFEMKALVARNAARAERFDKPQDTLTTDDWDAIAREAPQAGPESDRVDAYCQKQRAYGIPAEDPKKTAGEARAALCDQWSGPSQKLKGLHLAQLVKARPENTPGSAADDVLAPLRQTVLKRDPKLATDLGALNARLSQYLKTGDAGSLSSVLHDVESLDQKSGNTDVGARAALLEQIKQAAQTRAGPPQQAATIVFSAPQPRLTPDGGDVPSAAASTPAKPSATQSSAQLAQWQAKLAGAAAAGGPALAAAWAEFTKLFPQSMTADQFVKQLSGGVDVVSLVDRVAPLAAGLDARASALRFDADLAAFRAKTAALREQEASFAQSGQLPSQSAVDALDAELKRLQAAAPQERAAAIQSAAAEFRATAVEIGKRRLASESAERPLDKKLDDLLGRLQPAKPSEGTDLRREIDSALGDTSARAAEVALLRREYEAAKDGIAADARASLEAKLAQADDGVKKIAPAGLKRAFDAVAAEVRALVSAAPRKGASQAAINAWKAKWDAAVAALLGDSEAAEAAAGQWGRLDAEYKSWIGKSPSQQEQDDLKPSQGAAATMVALLKSMNEAMGRGELDITQWDDRYRQEILGKAASAVKVEDLGVFGQAFIQKGRVRDDASTLLRGLSGIKLTGDPAQDAAALDGFFDQSANKALLTDDVAAELPAPIRDYVLKRKAAAASGAPAAPALTPQAIADIQALQRLDRNEASKPSTQRVVTSLYLAYYDVARQAAAVLHCENYGKADVSIEQGRFRSEERASVPRAAAPEEPEGGEEGGQPQPKLSKPAAMTEAKKKEFCERFNGHSSLAAEVTPGELDFQRKLVDSVRPLLQDNDEARLSRASVETLRTMVAGLRGLDAQTKAALRKEGVDVDGIIRHEDQREIVSWTLTAGRLGPQDDRYRALRDDVLTSVYGQGYVDSVTAQSRKLKEAVGGAGADPAPVVAALDGLDNPAVLTRGFLARVAALGQSDRSKLSARDQAELAGWQMWKKVLDDRLAQPMPANFDAQKWGAINAEIQGARDSKDPAQLARALVWAGQPVFDAEMLRVGFDTTKVSAQPQSQDQVLDLQRVFILASVLEVKGDHRDPAVAAQIKAKLLEYLKTKVADGQVEARKQQLLESNNDEFTDRVRKLDAVVHTDAFKQLALAGQVRSYLDASTALDQMLTKAQSDPHLAASLAMSRAYGELQGRVGLSLRDAYAPDKLTVSGWIMGTEGEVSRERNYASHGVPNGTTTPKDHDGVIASQMGRGFHVPLDAPTARKLDGLFYSGGSADNRFVSLDNRYTEVLRPPATVSDHGHEVALFRGRLPGDADDKDIRYDPQTKQYYTLKPVWDAHHNRTEERQLITGGEHGAQVENVTIQRRLDDGRTLITDMQTAGGTVLSYRNSFRGSKDYALVDLAHHSLTARNGSLGMDFSLADAKSGHPNVGLAANLDRSTYRVTDVDGREVRDLVSRQYFDLSDAKNPKAKIETPESLGVNDAQHRPLTLTVVREQGFPTGQSLADVVKQGSFTKLPDYYTTKGPDGSAEGHSRVDFDVHLNTSGMSEREREAAYRKVAERITQAHHLGVIDSISGDGTEFEAQLSQMMGFFDGQLGRDGSVDVSYHVDHEGGVSTSRFTYNDNARRLDVADKGSALYVPYVRYVKLPDPNPEALGKEEPGMTGEELKGIRYNRWLAGMRQVTNKSGLFASWGDDNMPNGFMGDANGAYKYHTYGLAGDGKFQTIKVDGRDAGRIQATMDVGFLGLGYVGAAIGNGTRNYVAPAYFNTVGLPYTYLYMWVTGKSKEEAVKMLSAITGGIARGAFESVTDPVFIALTVATWGAGTIPALTLKVLQVVYKGVKTAEEIVKIVKTVEVTIKAVQTLVNLKFAYDMGKGLRETGGQVAHAIESGNPDDAYQASRGVSAFVVGFVAAHGLNEWLQGKSAGIQQDYAKFTTENAPAKPVETKAPTTTETQTQQQPQTQPQTQAPPAAPETRTTPTTPVETTPSRPTAPSGPVESVPTRPAPEPVRAEAPVETPGAKISDSAGSKINASALTGGGTLGSPEAGAMGGAGGEINAGTGSNFFGEGAKGGPKPAEAIKAAQEGVVKAQEAVKTTQESVAKAQEGATAARESATRLDERAVSAENLADRAEQEVKGHEREALESRQRGDAEAERASLERAQQAQGLAETAREQATSARAEASSAGEELGLKMGELKTAESNATEARGNALEAARAETDAAKAEEKAANSDSKTAEREAARADGEAASAERDAARARERADGARQEAAGAKDEPSRERARRAAEDAGRRAEAAEKKAGEARQIAEDAQKTKAEKTAAAEKARARTDEAKERQGETQARARAAEAETKAGAAREDASRSSEKAGAAEETARRAHQDVDRLQDAVEDARARGDKPAERARLAELSDAREKAARADELADGARRDAAAAERLAAKAGEAADFERKFGHNNMAGRALARILEADYSGVKNVARVAARNLRAVDDFMMRRNPLIKIPYAFATRAPLFGFKLVQSGGVAIESAARAADVGLLARLGLGKLGELLGSERLRRLGEVSRDPVTGERLVEVAHPDGTKSLEPAPPGYVRGTLLELAHVLQGRLFELPGERGPGTLSGVWKPDIAGSRGFRDALTPELKAKGGEIRAALDVRTGRLVYGEPAQGPSAAEVVFAVKPAAGGGVEVVGYGARAADPRVEAAAHEQLSARFDDSLKVPEHQARLDDLFASEAVQRALVSNGDPRTGETFVDLRYDESARSFAPGFKEGAPLVRLRLSAEPEGLRVTGAELLSHGRPLPFAAEFNLDLRSGALISVEGARPPPVDSAGEITGPRQAGRRLAEMMRARDAGVEAENVILEASARERVESAESRLARAEASADPSAARLEADLESAIARQAQDVVTQSELGRKAAADLARADERLAAEGVDAAQVAAIEDALSLSRTSSGAAGRRRVVEEDLRSAASRLTEGQLDAVVERWDTKARVETARADGREAVSRLRELLRTARDSGAEAGVALARGRLDAARRASLDQEAVLEYRREGIDSSVGAGGRARQELLGRARRGALDDSELGRRNVYQGQGTNHCVLGSLADQFGRALGREVSLREVETALVKRAGAREGERLIGEIERFGMTPEQMREWIPKLAESFGLKAAAVDRGDLFTEIAGTDRQVSVLLNTKPDAVTGNRGGAHMVNLSNFRMLRDPVTGRTEAVVDMADPNIRVRDERGGFDSKVVSVKVAELIPQIRGRFTAFGAEAAGFTFDAAPRQGAKILEFRPRPAARELPGRAPLLRAVGAGEPPAGLVEKVAAAEKVFNAASDSRFELEQALAKAKSDLRRGRTPERVEAVETSQENFEIGDNDFQIAKRAHEAAQRELADWGKAPRPTDDADQPFKLGAEAIETLADGANASFPPGGTRPPFLESYPREVAEPLLERFYTDKLTQIKNNKYLQAHAAELQAKYGDVVMMDGDYFGSVNRALKAKYGDTVGGLMADEVLARLVGNAAHAAERAGAGPVEIVRKGGEEILFFTEKGRGVEVGLAIQAAGERFRARDLELGEVLAQFKRTHGIEGGTAEVMEAIRDQGVVDAKAKAKDKTKPIDEADVRRKVGTSSAGVAQIVPRPDATPMEVIDRAAKRADRALAVSKDSGKSRVSVEIKPGGGITVLDNAKLPAGEKPARRRSTVADEAYERALARLKPADRVKYLEALQTDPQTGLGNREAIRDNMPAILRKFDHVYKFEIDNFKAVNDHPKLGHEAGDAVLLEFGRVVKEVQADVARELGARGETRAARDIAKEFHAPGSDAALELFARRLDERLAKDDPISRAAARSVFGGEPTDSQVKQVRAWIAEEAARSGKDPARIGTVTGAIARVEGARRGVMAYDEAVQRASEAVEKVKNERNDAYVDSIGETHGKAAVYEDDEEVAANAQLASPIAPPLAPAAARGIITRAAAEMLSFVAKLIEREPELSEPQKAVVRGERRSPSDKPQSPSAPRVGTISDALDVYTRGFYENAKAAGQLETLAFDPEFEKSGSNHPAYYADHGDTHKWNTINNSVDALRQAMKSGIIEPRQGDRAEFMEHVAGSLGAMHDMWMQDLSAVGRKFHPHRAAQEAFRGGFDHVVKDVMAGPLGRRVLELDSQGKLSQPPEQVVREILSMSYGHSKSNVPLRVLDDPAALRSEMQKTARAETGLSEADRPDFSIARYYERAGGFENSYRWITDAPELSGDVVDAIRSVRSGDAFRYRGAYDFRSLTGANISVDARTGRAIYWFADPISGRKYTTVSDNPFSIGEANTRVTRINERGELEMGTQRARYGSPEAQKTVAEATAHIFFDVYLDFAGSFDGVQGREIVIQRALDERGDAGRGFTEQVAAALRKIYADKLPELKKAGKLTGDEPLEIRIEDPPRQKAVDILITRKGAKLELDHYESGKPLDARADLDALLWAKVRDGGRPTEGMDQRAALKGARVVTLEPTSIVTVQGAPANYVYIPLELPAGSKLEALVGKGYEAFPLREGVPFGEIGPVTENPRSVDIRVAGTEPVKLLMLPRETYLKEWSRFYEHAELVRRLREDFPQKKTPPAEPTARPMGVGAGDDARLVFANRPEVLPYEGPIKLLLGLDDGRGRALEVLSVADAAARYPEMARRLPDPAIRFVVLDPLDTAQFKGIRRGEVIELGRENTYGRFRFDQSVSRSHLRLTGLDGGVRVEDLGSRYGTRIDAADIRVADSPEARRLRGEQRFNRTPDYPESPKFVENSRKANDVFNRWLSGEQGARPLRDVMEEMHRLYAGDNDIGKGQGGQYMEGGAPRNGRAGRSRDFVKKYYGLEPLPDGPVDLPGIPEKMSAHFYGETYYYPDRSVPGMRETYYKVLEGHAARFSELAAKMEALRASDPNYPSDPRYRALRGEALGAVVDFGRVAAAFRQFESGNWGLYGPMMNSMVNRLGLSIRHPGYLDIILQTAAPASLKPFFERSLLDGRDFYPADGYDPIKGRIQAPPKPAAPREPGLVDLAPNQPKVFRYDAPLKVSLGGEKGRALEILSRADIQARYPELASRLDPSAERAIVDPADPLNRFQPIAAGETIELGRGVAGRFAFDNPVSRRHLRVIGLNDGVRVEDLGSTFGTRVEVLRLDQKPSRPMGVGAGSPSRIEEIVGDPRFTPKDLIEELKKDPVLGPEYAKSVGVWEKYSLERHTLMMMGQFERYLKTELPASVDVGFFRQVLALHDIGKPRAVEAGDKARQHEFTAPMIREHLANLGYKPAQIDFAVALVDGDPIGPYVRRGDLGAAVAEIDHMAARSGLPPQDFYKALRAFYMSDAGSYTADAGGIPSLDGLFIFDRARGRMSFAPEIAERMRPLDEYYRLSPTMEPPRRSMGVGAGDAPAAPERPAEPPRRASPLDRLFDRLDQKAQTAARQARLDAMVEKIKGELKKDANGEFLIEDKDIRNWIEGYQTITGKRIAAARDIVELVRDHGSDVLALYDRRYRPGTTTYSGRKFDEAGARKFDSGLLRGMQDEGVAPSDIAQPSGMTNLGGVKAVYEAAGEHPGVETQGITTPRAMVYPVAEVDKAVSLGRNFGDESELFLAVSNAMVVIGGGGQAKTEALKSLKKMPERTVFALGFLEFKPDGTRAKGAADQIFDQLGEGSGGLWIKDAAADPERAGYEAGRRLARAMRDARELKEDNPFVRLAMRSMSGSTGEAEAVAESDAQQYRVLRVLNAVQKKMADRGLSQGQISEGLLVAGPRMMDATAGIDNVKDNEAWKSAVKRALTPRAGDPAAMQAVAEAAGQTNIDVMFASWFGVKRAVELKAEPGSAELRRYFDRTVARIPSDMILRDPDAPHTFNRQDYSELRLDIATAGLLKARGDPPEVFLGGREEMAAYYRARGYTSAREIADSNGTSYQLLTRVDDYGRLNGAVDALSRWFPSLERTRKLMVLQGVDSESRLAQVTALMQTQGVDVSRVEIRGDLERLRERNREALYSQLKADLNGEPIAAVVVGDKNNSIAAVAEAAGVPLSEVKRHPMTTAGAFRYERLDVTDAATGKVHAFLAFAPAYGELTADLVSATYKIGAQNFMLAGAGGSLMKSDAVGAVHNVVSADYRGRRVDLKGVSGLEILRVEGAPDAHNNTSPTPLEQTERWADEQRARGAQNVDQETFHVFDALKRAMDADRAAGLEPKASVQIGLFMSDVVGTNGLASGTAGDDYGPKVKEMTRELVAKLGLGGVVGKEGTHPIEGARPGLLAQQGEQLGELAKFAPARDLSTVWNNGWGDSIRQFKGQRRQFEIESKAIGPADRAYLRRLFELLPREGVDVVAHQRDPNHGEIVSLARERGLETIVVNPAGGEVRGNPSFVVKDEPAWDEFVRDGKNDPYETNKAQHYRLHIGEGQPAPDAERPGFLYQSQMTPEEIGARLDAESRGARQKVIDEIRERFAKEGKRAPEFVDPGRVDEFIGDRRPILFSGSSKKSWPNVSPENQRLVEDTNRRMLDRLDRKKNLLVTGGTEFGAEAIVHRLAAEKGFNALGTVVENTNAPDVSDKVGAYAIEGINWFGKSRPVLEMIKAHDGIVVFQGGGQILAEEIELALRMNVRVYLQRGPEGAAAEAAKKYPQHAFDSFDDLLPKLKQAGVVQPTLGERVSAWTQAVIDRYERLRGRDPQVLANGRLSVPERLAALAARGLSEPQVEAVMLAHDEGNELGLKCRVYDCSLAQLKAKRKILRDGGVPDEAAGALIREGLAGSNADETREQILARHTQGLSDYVKRLGLEPAKLEPAERLAFAKQYARSIGLLEDGPIVRALVGQPAPSPLDAVLAGFSKSYGVPVETARAALVEEVGARGDKFDSLARLIASQPEAAQRRSWDKILYDPIFFKSRIEIKQQVAQPRYDKSVYASAKKTFEGSGDFYKLNAADGGALIQDGTRLYRHVRADELARVLADGGLVPKALKQPGAEIGAALRRRGGVVDFVNARVVDNPEAKSWLYEYTESADRSVFGGNVPTAGPIKLEIVPRPGQTFVQTGSSQQLVGHNERGWATIDPVAAYQIKIFGEGCAAGCSLTSAEGQALARKLTGEGGSRPLGVGAGDAVAEPTAEEIKAARTAMILRDPKLPPSVSRVIERELGLTASDPLFADIAKKGSQARNSHTNEPLGEAYAPVNPVHVIAGLFYLRQTNRPYYDSLKNPETGVVATGVRGGVDAMVDSILEKGYLPPRSQGRNERFQNGVYMDLPDHIREARKFAKVEPDRAEGKDRYPMYVAFRASNVHSPGADYHGRIVGDGGTLGRVALNPVRPEDVVAVYVPTDRVAQTVARLQGTALAHVRVFTIDILPEH